MECWFAPNNPLPVLVPVPVVVAVGALVVVDAVASSFFAVAAPPNPLKVGCEDVLDPNNPPDGTDVVVDVAPNADGLLSVFDGFPNGELDFDGAPKAEIGFVVVKLLPNALVDVFPKALVDVVPNALAGFADVLAPKDGV